MTEKLFCDRCGSKRISELENQLSEKDRDETERELVRMGRRNQELENTVRELVEFAENVKYGIDYSCWFNGSKDLREKSLVALAAAKKVLEGRDI